MDKNSKFVVFFLISLFLAISVVWYLTVQNESSSKDVENIVGEIEKIKNSETLDEQTELYTRLIERVGPVEAQVALYSSGLPFNGQTHLLNHAVGDYVYEKYGTKGLVYCRDYFLSSCYHGFLIRAISAGGVDAVGNAVASCKTHGWPVYVQCAHAVGHGFLASEGYANLPRALELCDEVRDSVNDFPQYNCYDGVFMENVWAVHEGGEPSPERWIKQEDPHYPCTSDKIENKYLKGCWSNQASVMFELFEGDIGRIGKECSKAENFEFKETCFNGLARQIHPVAGEDIDEMFKMCGLLPSPWVDECLITIARSDFSVGGREVPYKICERMQKEGRGDDCYLQLSETISVYAASKKQRTEWCELIEDETWRSTCTR